MAFDGMTVVYILIATVLLWLFLFLSTRLIVSKQFASDKKVILLLTALLMVLLIALVSGIIVTILSYPGEGIAWIRNQIDGGGHNYVPALGSVITFIFFLLLLKFLVGMDWEKTVWVGLIAIFLLYLLYSGIPELDFLGALAYT